MKNHSLTMALTATALISVCQTAQAQDIRINDVAVIADGQIVGASNEPGTTQSAPPAQPQTSQSQTSQSQTPQPQAQPPAGSPQQYLQPKLKTKLEIDDQTFEVKGTVNIEVLPNGRVAIIFSDPTDLPANVEGFESTTLPDGRAALVKLPFKRLPLPPGSSEFIRLNGQAIVQANGTVDSTTDIATLPFRYKKTVRLKTDRMYKTLFGKEKIDIPVGSVGFYGGQFTSQNRPTQMMCLFAPSKPEYAFARCYLKFSGASPDTLIRDVGLLANVPLYFQAITYNYVENVNMVAALDIEEGNFEIPHDFKLTLRVKFWVDGKPALVWMSDGRHVRDELLQPDKDGQFNLSINGGKLTLKPVPDDKKKTVIEFVATP